MPMPNSMNTAKGRDFQQAACAILREHFRCGKFKLDCPVLIGNPPKEHKFDLVCEDGRYVGECKNYSWTETGNVPSAKLAFLNEAVFYLLHLPGDVQRFVALRRDVHPRRRESLAEFYFRTDYHLLDGVKVIEIDLRGYPVDARRYYPLWLPPTRSRYRVGPVVAACSISRWKSSPRARELRRLKRNVYSSR